MGNENGSFHQSRGDWDSPRVFRFFTLCGSNALSSEVKNSNSKTRQTIDRNVISRRTMLRLLRLLLLVAILAWYGKNMNGAIVVSTQQELMTEILEPLSLGTSSNIEVPAPTVSMCAVTRDEEAYIDEWTDYYLSLGFSEIFVYDNSESNDLLFWKNYSRSDDARIHIVHWPGRLVGQNYAYLDCAKRALANNHTWTAFFDVDEFLILRKHENIVSLLQEHCKSGALSINWYFFGTSGHVSYIPLPMTKRFCLRMPDVNPHVKTIVRLSDMDMEQFPRGAHYQNLRTGTQHDTRNNSFSGPFNPDGPTDVVVLHHIWTKSEKEYKFKTCTRGFVAHGIENRTLNFPHCGTIPPTGSVFDNAAWLELKKRVPRYAVFDSEEFRNRASLPRTKAKKTGLTVSVCAVTRDEEAYIDEWTDYYLALGFAEIFFYDNSENNELLFWKNYSRSDDSRIQIVHWPGRLVRQNYAYLDCAKRALAKNHTWTAFIDIDEFLILRKHENIVSLLEEHCKSGALSINWYYFGTNGHSSYIPQPMTKRFHLRLPDVDKHVKTIVLLSDMDMEKFPRGAHYQNLLRGTQHDTRNKSFVGPFNPDGPDDIVILHHIWAKSEKEFEHKACTRGFIAYDDEKKALNFPNCGRVPIRGAVYDDAAWLELKRRVPWYSLLDESFLRNKRVR